MKQLEISDKEYFELALRYLELKEGVSDNLIRQFYSYMAAAKGMRVQAPQNVALLPVNRISDLFSKQFMECLAFTLVNGAHYAQSKGVELSLDEVKGQVVAKVLKAMKQQKDPNVSFHKISMRNVAAGFGLSEERFLEAYKNVALFKRFLEGEKTQNLLDPLMAQKVSRFATQKARLDLFKMPSMLRLDSMEELFKFQCYLEATTGAGQDRRNLSLSLDVVDLDDLKRSAPELLKRQYVLNLKKVALSRLAMSIPLKKMLRWQLEDENFYAIADKFRQIQDVGAISEETRRKALDRLDENSRQQVDAYSRNQMVLQDPELLLSAFNKMSEERVIVDILLNGRTDLFEGLADSKEVMERLAHLEEKEYFTFDDEHFYQVTVLEKGESLEVIRYQEALKNGQLDLLLDRYLKTRYPQVRILYRDQFETEEGDWIPYELAKIKLEKIIFKDLLQAIEASCGYKGVSLEASEELYLDNRFKTHLENFVTEFEAKSLQELQEKIEVLKSSKSAFSQQFIPEIDSMIVDRATAEGDLRNVLDTAAVKALVGPHLHRKGEQAFVAIQEWLDADSRAISLVELQNAVGKATKKEALAQFFQKMNGAELHKVAEEKVE